jgi:hypothetical protein
MELGKFKPESYTYLPYTLREGPGTFWKGKKTPIYIFINTLLGSNPPYYALQFHAWRVGITFDIAYIINKSQKALAFY